MSQELPDGVELAKKCGATFYSHRSSPHEPAVAFSPVAWKAFTDALADREKQAARVPHWTHSCNALCVDDLKLWVDNCPHCGMPRYAAPTTEPGKAEQADAPSMTLDALTPQQFALRELYEFQEATGCDTAEQFKAMRWDVLRDHMLATQPPASNAGERELPPLPERERRFLCTKCGATTCKVGQERQTNPECSDCGYLGFAEDADFTAEQMQDYARAALATKPQAGDVAQDSDPDCPNCSGPRFCTKRECNEPDAARTRGEGGGT